MVERETPEDGVEEIEVPEVPEPPDPEAGEIDPADTYREGVDADE